MWSREFGVLRPGKQRTEPEWTGTEPQGLCVRGREGVEGDVEGIAQVFLSD